MRFLHTSDWHLGRSFLGVSLLDDQAHVLGQLVTAAVEAKVDAVLLAGDVYDRSVPPADAVRLLDETLTRLVIEAGIPVLVIAGNHDSAERLGFGSRLLAARGLHVAGNEPRVVTLHDSHGPVDFALVPFAEPAAVAARVGDPTIASHDSALRADLAALSADPAVLRADPAALRAELTALRAAPASLSAPSGEGGGHRQNPGRRVAIAHAFVSGGSTSESERPLVMGTAALVGADCFDGFAYAALGHLHRPQRIGRAEVRYSGSLLKYSFDEAAHRKSVSIVELDAAGNCRIEELSLSARRDVRILEGTLDDLRLAALDDSARHDYVLARLTDRGALLDPMGKLRDLYPNCLRVQRDEFFSSRGDAAGPRVDLRRHSEGELFDAFFREVTGEGPDEEEKRAFDDALVATRRAQEGDA